jgi:hypothetical protein
LSGEQEVSAAQSGELRTLHLVHEGLATRRVGAERVEVASSGGM